MRLLAMVLVALVACGGDDAPAPAKKEGAAPAKPGGAPAAGSGSGKPLAMPRKIESSAQITCPPPDEKAKMCEPGAARPVVLDPKAKPDPNDKSCPEGMYCLVTTKGNLCGPCPERDTIRQELKERDWTAEANRDPFQPFIIRMPGTGSGSGELPRDTTSRCAKPEQQRVPNFGYQSLKLVGIVAQGTQRKVLMMAPDNYGYIIKRGDCVGKEKAWVRDIGENFICFETQAEQGNAAAVRAPESLCIELHTKQVSVTSLPTEAPPPGASAPVITPPPPPPVVPPRGSGSGSGSAAKP